MKLKIRNQWNTIKMIKTIRIKIKWNKRIKRIAVLCCAFSLMMGQTAWAEDTQQSTEDKINDANSKLDELQDAKEEVQSQVDSLTDNQTTLSGDLADLNDQLETLSQQMEESQQKLSNKETEIQETTESLEEAQKQQKQQYADMKLRIQFMYENSNKSYLELLLESSSFAEMLNKAEYIEAVSTYDRSMLDRYEETVSEIETEKAQLETQKKDLESIQAELEDEEAQVEAVIEETQAAIAENNSKLEDAQSQADAYAQQIEEQEAYEQELEEQKAKEDAQRLAEIKKQEEEAAAAKKAAEEAAAQKAAEEAAQSSDTDSDSGTDSGSAVVSGSDQALLAAIIQCEAGGESYEGKLAVGSVVMNRVYSSYYPNTVAGVIYQSGQFSPVTSGRFATVLANGTNDSCNQAAAEVLGGNITVSYLCFRTNNGLIEGTVIGNHVFY